MLEPIVDQIIQNLEYAAELYNRLILVIGSYGSGKTEILNTVAERINIPVLNVNFELSRRMLDLTERQRALKVSQILKEIVAEGDKEVVIMDNTEILFDISLKQDPLRLLQGISRNKTIVASWNGDINDKHLFYAMPGHSEYRKYEIKDFLFVNLKAKK